MNAEASLDGNLAWLQDEMRANRARLPQQLINARRWMLWESQPNPKPDKKDLKVPYYVDGRKREKTDTPEDTARLATFDEAIAALVNDAVDTWNPVALGFALGPDDTGKHWQGFDADNIPAEHVERWIAEHAHLGYVEVSPSRRGVHVIGYGQHFATLGSNGTDVEAYAGGRFFTFTGDRGRGVPACIAAFVNGPVAERHGAARPTAKAAGGTISVDPKTVSELRSALNTIPADGYDLWIKIGRCLYELGNVGRELWLTWSQQLLKEKWNPDDAAKWNTFVGSVAPYQTVFKIAQEHGWVNPASNAAQLNAAAPTEGGFQFKFACAGETIVETDYLIDPWLPRATVMGCYGRGEAGKSSWTAQACAIASHQVSTLWISSEERPSNIRQRHLSCGGQENTLAVPDVIPTKIDPVTKKAVATSFNIYDHLEPAIEEFRRAPQARRDRPLGIVVLDAVVALVTWAKGENANSDEAVKRLIATLVKISERQGVTIIILGHLNKGVHGEHIADAVTGSAAWTNSVRLAYMFVKDIESQNYEGFVRTVKSNTGTHFGATYKTVPKYVLRQRPDGHHDVLCGIEWVTDVVWGELSLREMMAGEQGDKLLDRIEQKTAKVDAIVQRTLNLLQPGRSTTRKEVEATLPEKVSRRHWQKADEILAREHGVQMQNDAHNVRVYSRIATAG